MNSSRLSPVQALENGPRRQDTEATPLLASSDDNPHQSAKAAISVPVFLLIEFAIFANVFLAGFDGTVTATTYTIIASEFNALDTASWISTSYLLTSTACQPLYGRYSDIFGRRICFIFGSATFALGCLGCSLSQSIIVLNLMRALTGIGGAGLLTLDLVSSQQRGMYQAAQNILFGAGSICGASFGGTINDWIGWRACFYLQVPISVAALVIGGIVIKDTSTSLSAAPKKDQNVDLTGSALLVISLLGQISALSMYSLGYSWSDWQTPVLFVASIAIFAGFIVTEWKTTAKPIIPLFMLSGLRTTALLFSNTCLGFVSYGILFTMPLFFQTVLLDTPARSGIRMIASSASLPVGGIINGLVMTYRGSLTHTFWAGSISTFLGCLLLLWLGMHSPQWTYIVFMIPGNLGIGLSYPSSLFKFMRMFDAQEHAVATSVIYLTRNMGMVWGVSATASLIQQLLASRLPGALEGIEEKQKIIDMVLHSSNSIGSLKPAVRSIIQTVYYEVIRKALICLCGFSFVALVAALFIDIKCMDHGDVDEDDDEAAA